MGDDVPAFDKANLQVDVSGGSLYMEDKYTVWIEEY